ncbi:SGNH hydrolase-type esterase domain-containing protein, partial [Tanacetum coccineum]
AAESLGLPLIPPYVHDKGNENAMALKQGVNYAAAGATALNSSVLEARGIVNPLTNASLGVQLEWFKRSLPSICGNIAECKNLIGRSLILVGEIGGNDYNFPILAGKPIDEFKSLVPLVIDTIISAVNELIEMGARTLVVPGNLPIGCSAAYLTVCGSETEEYDPTTGCLVRLNECAAYQNELLQMKLNRIRELHADVNVIYADYYNAAMQIYRSPDKYGFTNGALKACCGGHRSFNFDSSEACGSASAPLEAGSSSSIKENTSFNIYIELSEPAYTITVVNL